MKRSKKAPQIKYGIEIVKPHSKEMYDHNDKVAEQMENRIMIAWSELLDIARQSTNLNLKEFRNQEWCDVASGYMLEMQRTICYTGYGDGFTLGEVEDDIIRTVQTSENWRKHEMYQELCEDRLVPKLEMEMVGFTNNYNKDNASYAKV